MKFSYTIQWTDRVKNTMPILKIGGDDNMALYIAKKKLDEGMENVVIRITKEVEGKEDEYYPAIDSGDVE